MNDGPNDGESPTVSVIVVDWRQPDLTERCIASLETQLVSESVEIVLVENEATAERTSRLRRSCPRAKLLALPTNEGFADGVNAGLAAAVGDIVVLVNNDAIAAPGFLQAGVDRMVSENETVAAVAASMVLEGRFIRVPAAETDERALVGVDGTIWKRSDDPGAWELFNSTGTGVDSHANGWDRDWLIPVEDVSTDHRADPFGFSGGGVFLRRSALENVGGFDGRFFMYYEDLDLAWRLRLAGYRIVFEPGARLIHRHAGSSAHGSSLLRFQSMRNRMLAVYKNGTITMSALVTMVSLGRMVKDAAVAVKASARRATRDGSYLSAQDWWRLWKSVVVLFPSIVRERRGVAAMVVADTSRRDVERVYFRRN